jgi:CheY-like chemotaxis protein
LVEPSLSGIGDAGLLLLILAIQPQRSDFEKTNRSRIGMQTISSALVIDDNPDVLKTLRKLLSSLGVGQVTDSLSAEEALEILRKRQFAVIVADYQLGGMNGVEFLEQLRAGGDNTPVLLLSGAPDKAGVIRAVNLPSVDFLGKPFRTADLFASLERLFPASIEAA